MPHVDHVTCMDSAQRAEQVRRGNQAFNEGNYRLAREIFIQADYKDGLIRIGDYYMYKKRMPLLAYGCYMRAGAKVKVEDIKRRMLGALGEWIGRDKFKPESPVHTSVTAKSVTASLKVDRDGMVPITVNKRLKNAAFSILSHRSSASEQSS